MAQEVLPPEILLLGLFLAWLLLIAGGVGLLLSPIWGRYLTLAYAAVSFASSLAYVLALSYINRPGGIALAAAMEREDLGPSRTSETVFFQIPALAVGLGYPVIVWITLFVKKQWSGRSIPKK
jgi:hypothetical protein